MKQMHLAIAEDNPIALKTIVGKLSEFKDTNIRYCAGNGKQLCEHIDKHPVDIILMDLDMPLMNGIDACKEIRKRFPQIKVLVLTTFDDDEKIFEAIMAGACGYLLKEEPKEKIHSALIETIDGGAAMSPIIAMKALKLIRNPLQPQEDSRQDFGLSAREIELLEQLKEGLSYEQLAGNLCISVGTVRKHIENIYRKLQVNNKMHAVRIAQENRII